MQNRIYVLLASLVCTVICPLPATYSQEIMSRGPVPLNQAVNSDAEDYAPTFVLGIKSDTLFFTSARETRRGSAKALRAELFYSVRPAQLREQGADIRTGWTNAQAVPEQFRGMVGVNRGSMSVFEDRIVFSAERDLSLSRTVSGTSYLLDLYESTRTLDGFAQAQPLDSVNAPNAWDSQPCLSPDGRFLFFVSNRKGGQGGLDIWVSVRASNGEWTTPRNCAEINTPGDELSPHVGADGNFYFAGTWDYNLRQPGTTGRDLFRASFLTAGPYIIPARPVLLDEALSKEHQTLSGDSTKMSINSDEDDEFPSLSADKTTFFFSSNRAGGGGRRDIYSFRLPPPTVKLVVNVWERLLDNMGNVLIPYTQKAGVPVTITRYSTGESNESRSGQWLRIESGSTYMIAVPLSVQSDCFQDSVDGLASQTLTVPSQISKDTVLVKNFYLSRKTNEVKPIIFYSTDTLPFFITGYWYPSTTANLRKFRAREAAGFFGSTGFVDSSDYDYDRSAMLIEEQFDERVYQPLERILPRLQEFCGDTLYLKVTTHGYTDPRSLSDGSKHRYRKLDRIGRYYPDSSVEVGLDAQGNPVQINTGHDMNQWRYQYESNIPGQKSGFVSLPDSGQRGNILLSKLRAFFMAKTFDDEMSVRSKLYRELRSKGRILFQPEGFGIDKASFAERGLRDDPRSRRIEVYLDVLRFDELDGHRRVQGGNVLTGKLALRKRSADTPGQDGKGGSSVSRTKQDSSANSIRLSQDTTKEVSTCRTVLYFSTSNKELARRAATLIESQIAGAVVVDEMDDGSKVMYLLRSACLSSPEDLIKARDDRKSVSPKLKRLRESE